MLDAKLFARKPGKMLCMETKGQIVRAWRERMGWSPRELGERIDTSRQNIENLEADAVDQPRYLPRLAKLMGYSTVEELLELKVPPGVDLVLHDQTTGTVALIEVKQTGSGVAQSLSQSKFRMPSQPMSWGDLKMKTELDDVFEVVLEDDAMAPEFPAGTIIKFRKGSEAKFGDRVLLRDRTGEFHFREYTQTFDGEPFEGLATGRGFRNILPRQHGAAVVAIKAGHYVEGS
jgi:transcriptional regulator with XRE-family HTH domain